MSTDAGPWTATRCLVPDAMTRLMGFTRLCRESGCYLIEVATARGDAAGYTIQIRIR